LISLAIGLLLVTTRLLAAGRMSTLSRPEA
jgi:hypothetical protein